MIKKIGLDFDGVISDCGALKTEGARRLYGLSIPSEKFKTEILLGEKLLTLEQYRNIQKQIYGTMEYGLLMQKVEGVSEYTKKLIDEGYNLNIVTSRGAKEAEVAREWMKIQGLNIPLSAIGGDIKKTDACRGLDVYIDDDLDKLEPLIGVVPYRFLFSWGYNSQVDSGSIAKRVNSWQDFYEEVKALN
jgi:uncharacterized HAD superfamily protein